MKKPGVHTIIDNLPKVLAGIEVLTTTQVMVGVPDSNAGREDGPISNASLAYIHDNGAPEVNIPKREFLAPGVKNVQGRINEWFRKIGDYALAGRPEAVEKGLYAIGLITQSSIKAKIRSGPFTPLKDSTLEARRRRGVKRTKPLIDTTQLLNSINFVIRKIRRK